MDLQNTENDLNFSQSEISHNDSLDQDDQKSSSLEIADSMSGDDLVNGNNNNQSQNNEKRVGIYSGLSPNQIRQKLVKSKNSIIQKYCKQVISEFDSLLNKEDLDANAKKQALSYRSLLNEVSNYTKDRKLTHLKLQNKLTHYIAVQQDMENYRTKSSALQSKYLLNTNSYMVDCHAANNLQVFQNTEENIELLKQKSKDQKLKYKQLILHQDQHEVEKEQLKQMQISAERTIELLKKDITSFNILIKKQDEQINLMNNKNLFYEKELRESQLLISQLKQYLKGNEELHVQAMDEKQQVLVESRTELTDQLDKFGKFRKDLNTCQNLHDQKLIQLNNLEQDEIQKRIMAPDDLDKLDNKLEEFNLLADIFVYHDPATLDIKDYVQQKYEEKIQQKLQKQNKRPRSLQKSSQQLVQSPSNNPQGSSQRSSSQNVNEKRKSSKNWNKIKSFLQSHNEKINKLKQFTAKHNNQIDVVTQKIINFYREQCLNEDANINRRNYLNGQKIILQNQLHQLTEEAESMKEKEELDYQFEMIIDSQEETVRLNNQILKLKRKQKKNFNLEEQIIRLQKQGSFVCLFLNQTVARFAGTIQKIKTVINNQQDIQLDENLQQFYFDNQLYNNLDKIVEFINKNKMCVIDEQYHQQNDRKNSMNSDPIKEDVTRKDQVQDQQLLPQNAPNNVNLIQGQSSLTQNQNVNEQQQQQQQILDIQQLNQNGSQQIMSNKQNQNNQQENNNAQSKSQLSGNQDAITQKQQNIVTTANTAQQDVTTKNLDQINEKEKYFLIKDMFFETFPHLKGEWKDFQIYLQRDIVLTNFCSVEHFKEFFEGLHTTIQNQSQESSSIKINNSEIFMDQIKMYIYILRFKGQIVFKKSIKQLFWYIQTIVNYVLQLHKNIHLDIENSFPDYFSQQKEKKEQTPKSQKNIPQQQKRDWKDKVVVRKIIQFEKYFGKEYEAEINNNDQQRTRLTSRNSDRSKISSSQLTRSAVNATKMQEKLEQENLQLLASEKEFIEQQKQIIEQKNQQFKKMKSLLNQQNNLGGGQNKGRGYLQSMSENKRPDAKADSHSLLNDQRFQKEWSFIVGKMKDFNELTHQFQSQQSQKLLQQKIIDANKTKQEKEKDESKPALLLSHILYQQDKNVRSKYLSNTRINSEKSIVEQSNQRTKTLQKIQSEYLSINKKSQPSKSVNARLNTDSESYLLKYKQDENQQEMSANKVFQNKNLVRSRKQLDKLDGVRNLSNERKTDQQQNQSSALRPLKQDIKLRSISENSNVNKYKKVQMFDQKQKQSSIQSKLAIAIQQANQAQQQKDEKTINNDDKIVIKTYSKKRVSDNIFQTYQNKLKERQHNIINRSQSEQIKLVPDKYVYPFENNFKQQSLVMIGQQNDYMLNNNAEQKYSIKQLLEKEYDN